MAPADVPGATSVRTTGWLRRGVSSLTTLAAFAPEPGGTLAHFRPRGLPCITPRDHPPRRDPEDGRGQQIRAHEQEQLHAAFPSVDQSGSDRQLAEGVGFSPDAFCDGFVLHGVLAGSLQFNPQALDACQPMPILFDSGTVSHGCSMRQSEQLNSPRCSYTRRLWPFTSASGVWEVGGC